MQMHLFVLAVGSAQDKARSTDGEESAVFNNATLLGGEFHVIDKGARIAVVVLEGVSEISPLVTADGDRAMVQINTGIDGLKGSVGGIAFLVAAYHIVAHTEGDDLFVVKHVLDHDNGAAALFVGLLVRMLVFLALTEFAHAHADAKLLATFGTFEDQRLAFRIFRLIKDDVLVTFWTAYSLHGQLK